MWDTRAKKKKKTMLVGKNSEIQIKSVAWLILKKEKGKKKKPVSSLKAVKRRPETEVRFLSRHFQPNCFKTLTLQVCWKHPSPQVITKWRQTILSEIGSSHL